MFTEIFTDMMDALSIADYDKVQFILDFIELPDIHSSLSDDEYQMLRSFSAYRR